MGNRESRLHAAHESHSYSGPRFPIPASRFPTREPPLYALRDTSCRASAGSHGSPAGSASADCTRTAPAAGGCSDARSRTTPSSCGPRSAVAGLRCCARPGTAESAGRAARRRRRLRRGSFSTRDSAIASSIASFVPEPIEKCAVCAASPISTTLSWNHDALRTIGKLSHCEPRRWRMFVSRRMAVEPRREHALARRDRSRRCSSGRSRRSTTSARRTRR